MAKKGQIFNKYTEEQRENITLEYINGKGSYGFIARKYNISWKTLETWVRKFRNKGTLNIELRGRPKSSHLTEIEKLRLENEILKKFQTFLKEQQEKK